MILKDETLSKDIVMSSLKIKLYMLAVFWSDRPKNTVGR